MIENKDKNIITITGKIAAGKTAIVKILSNMLGMGTYSSSESFRRLARENNMSVTEFNEYVRDYPAVDRQIDEATEDYIKDSTNIIVDARLGWYVVPQSFKVYIKVDLKQASKRLVQDAKNRGEEEKYIDELDAERAIILREHFEVARYMKEYKVDIFSESNYDLVVDTTNITLEEAANIIKEEYEKWGNKKK